jgi:hypothetical protein
MATPEEWDRLQYLEEKQARRGLTDEEGGEMWGLLVAVGLQERFTDPVSGEQRYRPVKQDGVEYPI